MASKEDVGMSSLKSQLSECQAISRQETEENNSQVDALLSNLMEVKACLQESEEEDIRKELEVLWRIVKTTGTMLTYLKTKARMMAIPPLAQASCGIKQLDGVGLVDKNGVPQSNWSDGIDLSFSDDDVWIRISSQQGSVDKHGTYIDEVLKTVEMVSRVMETLVKRVIMAESETFIEKEKVTLAQEEIRKKVMQIDDMSLKLEEMEKFAFSTNCILNEMKQRVEDLVDETSTQRQRAAENEEELCRVKQEFESLKYYVNTLINVRETLLSSEKQFQTIERLFERLVVKTNQLECEKEQKEVEVQKLIKENVRLSALLDKKEAQLLAMNEQCKVMALNSSGI